MSLPQKLLDRLPIGHPARIEAGIDVLPTLGRTAPVYAFRDRFTQAELVAIMNAAYAGDENVRLLLLKIQTASEGVPLDSPSTLGGLQYLVSIGVLAANRPAEIVA